MTIKHVAIITSGASGIGQQTCLKFAQKGDQVIVADYDETGGEKTLQLIREQEGKAISD